MLQVTVKNYAEARLCPFRSVLDKLGDKWTFLIMAVLEDEPRRFNEIRRLVGDISQRVLTSKLRDLERDGYVSRRVHAVSPPCVEYKLTRVGRSALRPIARLMKWALKTQPQIEKSRSRYDARRETWARSARTGRRSG
jgi:DNA-binding HxlR family transcriptional regulator